MTMVLILAAKSVFLPGRLRRPKFDHPYTISASTITPYTIHAATLIPWTVSLFVVETLGRMALERSPRQAFVVEKFLSSRRRSRAGAARARAAARARRRRRRGLRAATGSFTSFGSEILRRNTMSR